MLSYSAMRYTVVLEYCFRRYRKAYCFLFVYKQPDYFPKSSSWHFFMIQIWLVVNNILKEKLVFPVFT